MADNKYRIARNFTGLDTDNILERVGPGAIVDGRNLRIYTGKNGKSQAVRKLGGTKEWIWDAPAAGNNKGIGTYWDATGDTMIVFMYNDAGNHSIVWVHPNEPVARVIVIPELNLQADKPIVGCRYINQDLLVFTDGGDYPKCINLKRADNTNKKPVVNMFLPIPPQGTITTRGFSVSINGGPLQFVTTANAQQVHDFSQSITLFADTFNTNGALNTWFRAEACGMFIKFTALNVGNDFIEGSVNDIVGGIQPCVSEYANRYNDPFTDEQLRLARVAPLNSPTVVLGYDDGHAGNNILGKIFQFQYAFRFKDKERSLTSPTSDIALPATAGCTVVSASYNCVDIDFDNEWLDDPAVRGEIEHVRLFVLEVDGESSATGVNTGSWKLFQTLDKWEWMFNRTFRFYNDGTYQPSEQAYHLQGNTYVPQVANALELITDSDDNTRVVFGGIKEGDPTPCVDVTANVRINSAAGNPGTAKLVAKVYIGSGFAGNPGTGYRVSQPVGTYNGTDIVFGGMGPVFHQDTAQYHQTLPVGGFTFYAAGTDLIGITRQNYPAANLPCGINRPTLWQPPTNSPATGRNVFDLRYDGNATTTDCNDEYRSAVRHSIEQFLVWQDLEIDGLVPGETYIIRMASNKVNFDTGDIYDLNDPGRGYQLTSGPVYTFGTISALGIVPGEHECIVTVPPNGGGTTIDIGNIWVWDCSNPTPALESTKIHGYAIDANGSTDGTGGNNDIRKVGSFAERQLIAFRRYSALGGYQANPVSAAVPPDPGLNSLLEQGFAPTDHNGYFFFWDLKVALSNLRAVWLGVTGNTTYPSGTINVWTPANINVSWFTVLNDIQDDKFEADLDSTPFPAAITGNLPSIAGAVQLIIPNISATARQWVRTHITGRLVTGAGVPVPGIAVTLTSGKTEVTQTDGTFDMVAYGDVLRNRNDRIRDSMVLRSTTPCRVGFLVQPVQVLIDRFSQTAGYGEPQPLWYPMGDILALLPGLVSQRGFGRGATHGVVCYLQRDNGDRTPAQVIGKVRVPELNQDLHTWDPFLYPVPATFQNGLGVVDWTLGGTPPIPWIGRWSVLRFALTYDLTREWYVQAVASDITYSTKWDETNTEPTATVYGNSNATEIYIDMGSSFTRYSKMHTASMTNGQNATTGYLWQRGDRLKILTTESQQLTNIVVDVPIVGQRDPWIIVEANSSIPFEVKTGMVIEIYRPRKAVESEVQEYYDLPYQVKINYDVNGNPSWDQTSGVIEWGATWVVPRAWPVRESDTAPWTTRNYLFESCWIWDNYRSIAWGHGKPWFTDVDAATEYRGSLMRYTDSYKPGTNINGLNFVGGLNLRVVENWLGPIRKMERIGDVVFVACENGAFSIYVGIEQLQTTPNSTVETAGGILGTVRPFAHKFGCRDPLSFIRSQTTIWFYDRTNAAFVQWASNQLQDMGVQKDTHSWFVRKTGTLEAGTVVAGGWDMVNGEAVLSFAPHRYDTGRAVIVVPGESITYHDAANMFVSKVDMHADCIGMTRQKFWSIRDGRIWLHDVDGQPLNNIQGNQLDLEVHVPFNDDETVLKNPLAIWLARGKGWDSPMVRDDGTQRSVIPLQDFTTRRGDVSKAPLWRDSNTPLTQNPLSGGDQLEATAFVVVLRHQGSEECYLVNAVLYYKPVDETGI